MWNYLTELPHGHSQNNFHTLTHIHTHTHSYALVKKPFVSRGAYLPSLHVEQEWLSSVDHCMIQRFQVIALL